jgi:isocitrate/isopropylmalate dehydrogenase
MTRTHRICVLPGDGIGPEVTAVAVIAVLEAGPVTRDLGGRATTGDVADALLGRLGETVSGGRT